MLGKNGDVLSILPCLQEEFRETGKKPTLVVSRDYAALPKCFPWLNVEVFDGPFDHLGSALRWAKRFGRVDFVPQIHGVGYPKPARNNPSFQYDQWERMGRLSQWGKLPLSIPSLPNSMPQTVPLPSILFADHSQSSPFPHVEDLFAALKENFPLHHVTRLSSIRLPRLIDFVALYDASDILVTVDTAHLHLSLATKTPVIALATDVPSLWHGSGHHPRFAAHIRYKDYELRKSELLWTAKKCVALKR